MNLVRFAGWRLTIPSWYPATATQKRKDWGQSVFWMLIRLSSVLVIALMKLLDYRFNGTNMSKILLPNSLLTVVRMKPMTRMWTSQ